MKKRKRAPKRPPPLTRQHTKREFDAWWPAEKRYLAHRAARLGGTKPIGERLHAMSREGRWAEMPGAISEEMLDAFVPTAPYADIADLLRERYAGESDWITFPMPEDPGEDAAVAEVIASLREGS